MARDDMARDFETERSPLDRRSSLTLAGATATSLATTAAVVSADTVSSDATATSTGDETASDGKDALRYSGSVSGVQPGRAAVVEVRDGSE